MCMILWCQWVPFQMFLFNIPGSFSWNHSTNHASVTGETQQSCSKLSLDSKTCLTHGLRQWFFFKQTRCSDPVVIQLPAIIQKKMMGVPYIVFPYNVVTEKQTMDPYEKDLMTICIFFQDCEFSVRVSFLEIYNEELFDLLSPCMDNQKMRLFEDSTRKVRQ